MRRQWCWVLLSMVLLCPLQVVGQGEESERGQEDLLLTKGRFRDPFLSRFDAPYLNYGWTDYENYREAIPIFKRYDALGNYLTEGYEIFRMEEFRAASANQPGSILLKGRFYQNWMRHLVVADDAYGGWSTRITVGDAIRTRFTPLTLDLSRYNGIRWDEASANNRFTIIVSRFSDPVKLDLKNQLGPGGKRVAVTDGLYLMGGHWESHLGDFLVLGATYINMHRFDSSRGFTTNTRKGLAPPHTTPTQLTVRFQDDSPEDNFGGAVVFEVQGTARIVEEGVERFETIEPRQIEQSDGVIVGPRHLEASGLYQDRNGFRLPVSIDYHFDVPDSTVGVTIAAVVANDYRILIGQDHDFFDTSRDRSESRTTPFLPVRRAEDNVVDLSNKRRVVFEHGMQTGQEIVGINAQLKVKGFDVKGEVARSTDYFQYASKIGSRDEFDDFGGYLTISKKLPGVVLGAEGFYIGPKYNSYASRSQARVIAESSPELGDDGVELNVGDGRSLGPSYYFNSPRQDPISTDATEGGNRTNTPIYALVDDNDDMDQWPDDWVQDWDIANREIKYLESDAGIYPFFDFDADGYADNNRNRNQLADSEEAFLMYFTDPREFYWGDDFNNNFILDAWEDDDQPNYPYFKDEKGYHITATTQLAEGVQFTFGRYDVDQIAGGNSNEVTYGRLRLQRQLSGSWWGRWDHEAKTVEDGIANPYFDFRIQELSGGRLVPTQFYFADFLDARDSFIHRGLFHARFRPRESWNLNAKWRYEFNHQRAIAFDNGDQQIKDDLDYIGFLVKGDYTRHLGKLAVMPRFKVQYQRRERQSIGLAFLEELMVVPILRLDYHLTSRSQIRLGAQGMPLLVDRRIDYRDRDNDAKKQTYVLAWFNQSDYSGYKIGTEAGAEYQLTDFDVAGRSDESFVRYFVRMIAGVGSVR
ncbi:MAG: hypothetical protein GKR89_10290 [Candidatus Latescibacteria bacterium]|nr:hypothetical protein [Candidatus Latescibacterota bacterium]